MLTGSFASSAHGTPRATQDIDLVIAPTRTSLLRLLEQLPSSEFYVSKVAALAALSRRSQFNVIEVESGWKVDLIIRKARPFSLAEFDRRSLLDIGGVELFMATAEDTVISKLEWAKLGGSDRQIEDVAGIVRMQGENLNVDYLENWVKSLGLEKEWNEAREQAASR